MAKDYKKLINILKNLVPKLRSINLSKILKNYPSKLETLTLLFKKRTRRFLSIDFGQAFVKIIYLEFKNRNYKILNYDLQKLSSIQEDNKEIISFINNFIEKNSIVKKAVYLTISDLDSTVINNITLPAIPKRELTDALKWQIKDKIPFDLKDVLLDWQVVKEYTDNEGTKQNGIVYILTKKETVNKYLSIIEECNLYPLRISCAPFNYANILTYIEKDESKTTAILDIGYKQATLCIYKSDKLNFIRMLPFSADKLTRLLTSTLSSDRGGFQLSYDQAENIKQAFGIPQQDDKIILEDNVSGIQIQSLMRNFLEGLIRELKLSFGYFASNFGEENPSILYITGGGGGLKNLHGYLERGLNIKVSKLALPNCVDTEALPKEALDKSQSQITSALGVVLAGYQAINLLPRGIKAQKLEFIEQVSLRVVGTTAAAILLLSFLFVQLQIHDYKNRLKHAEQHLQTIRGVKEMYESIELTNNLINTIQTERVPTAGLLKAISTLIPHNIILNELLLGQDKHVLILRGIASGKTDISASVINFMERIETSLFFLDARLVSSKRIAGVQEFEIQCDLAH